MSIDLSKATLVPIDRSFNDEAGEPPLEVTKTQLTRYGDGALRLHLEFTPDDVEFDPDAVEINARDEKLVVEYDEQLLAVVELPGLAMADYLAQAGEIDPIYEHIQIWITDRDPSDETTI